MNHIKPILTALYVLHLRASLAFWSWRVRTWAHAIRRATACIERHPQSFPQQGENLAYYRGKVEAARARALRAGAELELIAERRRGDALVASVREAQRAVLAFHQRFGISVRPFAMPSIRADTREDRYKLMREELAELRGALGEGDVARAAREMADLLYVVLGTAVEIGVDLGPVFAEVHRANMDKQQHPDYVPGEPSFHMIVKPPGWKPPRVSECIEAQRSKAVRP